LFPAAILLGLGLIVFGVASLAPLAAFGWIISYWPAVLVLLGLWILFRDQLPPATRRPIATAGGLALLAYGILAAAASVATSGTLTRSGVGPSFGGSPFVDTISLDAPIPAGQTFTVDNPNSRTTIHGGSDSGVHVVATRHFNIGGNPPDVRLNPSSGGLSLDAPVSNAGHFPFGHSSSVEYAIEVPPGVNVRLQSSSGQVEIDGVTGSVEANTNSGQMRLSNLSGAVQAHASSGSIQLNNIAGELKVSTQSGQILGSGLRHVREASTSSGYVSLEGIFTDAGQIHASSGAVNVKFLSDSAVQLDVRTSSGNIVATGLPGIAPGGRQRSLQTSLGTPAPEATLKIDTSSGAVILSQ
jgi:hypothetical protein